MGNIAIIGTFDTKETEASHIKNKIEKFGHNGILVDVSMREYQNKFLEPDFSNEDIARAAGESIKDISELERNPALKIITKGAKKIVKNLHENNKLDGILGYGGSTGESIAIELMKTLPLGVPKVLLTTTLELATGPVEHKDIVLVPTITDMSGGNLNRVEIITLANGASAIAGMVKGMPQLEGKNPIKETSKWDLPQELSGKKYGESLIVASQYGNTTPHIEKAREILEDKGHEFASFHAVGTGGKAMEELVKSGAVDGVLDITTHELVAETIAGFTSAGPNRMETAGKEGVPQVLSPGCLDMIQFWSPDTVPKKFDDRLFYFHNPNSTLMRTNKNESSKLGKVFAKKANKSRGPTFIAVPLNGWSICDTEGGVEMVDYEGNPTGKSWHNPETTVAFVDSLEKHLNQKKDNIKHEKFDLHINDPKFAEITSQTLSDMVERSS